MKKCLGLIVALTLLHCTTKEQADLLVINATIYTVDSNFSTAEAFAVKDGKIVGVGSQTNIESQFEASEVLDAEGHTFSI